MSLLSNAEISVRGDGQTISGILPATALPIHMPMYVSAVDAATGEMTLAVATGNRCDGLLTRASTAAGTLGSSTAYLLFGTVTPSGSDNGVYETSFEGSKPGSIEPCRIGEFEGSDYIDTGITADTAAGTPLDFSSGKFHVATGPTTAPCVLVAQMTPNTAGNVRIKVEFTATYKAA